MKDRTKRINVLKLEIEQLQKQIEQAEKLGKKAYATRLKLINQKKQSILKCWILNS